MLHLLTIILDKGAQVKSVMLFGFILVNATAWGENVCGKWMQSTREGQYVRICGNRSEIENGDYEISDLHLDGAAYGAIKFKKKYARKVCHQLGNGKKLESYKTSPSTSKYDIPKNLDGSVEAIIGKFEIDENGNGGYPLQTSKEKLSSVICH